MMESVESGEECGDNNKQLLTENSQVYNNARGERGESQEKQVNIQPAPRLYN